MTTRALAIVAAAFLTTSLAAQQRAPGNESITQADLRADLFFLAGDAMRGRLTDTNENRATADYIRARFERAGLKPAAGNSYFHNYNLMTATLGQANELKLSMPNGSAREWKVGIDFYPQRFSGSGTASGAVTFAGFGITAPKWSYDDYKGDVKGKIVLVLDHEPGERDSKSPFEGVVTAEPAVAWRKALAAQTGGAVAILFVSDVHNHPDAAEFRTGGAQFLAGRAGAHSELHAGDVDRSPSDSRVADLAGPRRDAHRRQRQDARGVRQDGRGRNKRLHRRRDAELAHRDQGIASIATSCPIATCSA